MSALTATLQINTEHTIRPATNTVVEAEFSRMLVPGVSFHSGRIEIANPNLSTDEAMIAFLEHLRVTIEAAVKSVLHCLPTYLVMGMTLELLRPWRRDCKSYR